MVDLQPLRFKVEGRHDGVSTVRIHQDPELLVDYANAAEAGGLSEGRHLRFEPTVSGHAVGLKSLQSPRVVGHLEVGRVGLRETDEPVREFLLQLAPRQPQPAKCDRQAGEQHQCLRQDDHLDAKTLHATGMAEVPI